MSNPDPIDPVSNYGRESPHSLRRLWRWGIWFWIVVWIFSIVVASGLKFKLKDRHSMTLGVAHGCFMGIRQNQQETREVDAITWIAPAFIWSEHERLYSEHPEFMFEWLGGVIWRTFGDNHMMSFPMSGFLWLWLLGGWVACVRKKQRLDFRNKRILVQAATLILLPLVIYQASRTSNKVWTERETSGCMMYLRNIQCAARSYWGVNGLSSGKPIPWDEIFGHGKFLPTSSKTCPSGLDYILDARIPAEYRLLVKCPNPDLQRRLKQIDTSGW